MAQKLQVLLTCDLDDDEVEAVETVTFGYEGANYAFELCAEHLDELNNVMHGYIASARRADGPTRRARSRGGTARAGAGEGLGAVRAWAREAGYEVSDRGRIPAEVRQAYDAAHNRR